MALLKQRFTEKIRQILSMKIEVGKSLDQADENSLILFPFQANVLSCGICAFVAFKDTNPNPGVELNFFLNEIPGLEASGLPENLDGFSVQDQFLGGKNQILEQLFENAQALKKENLSR